MSLSNPNNFSKNPAKKTIEFKNGAFQYYDKEKAENIELPFPFKFIVLDELSSISGYDEQNTCGIYSNEVHFTPKEELTVKSFKGGSIAQGLYVDIKDKVKARGGKFTRVVYALIDDELVKINLKGAALSSWFEKEFEAVSVVVEKTKDGKKGATTYKIPIFEEGKISEEDLEKAKKEDEELQKYFKNKGTEKIEPETQPGFEEEVTAEDLPF